MQLDDESKKEIDNNFYISGYTVADISDIDEEAIIEKQDGGFFAYDGYNFIDSFDNINFDEFEAIFYYTYGIIKDFELNDLRIICRAIIEKIKDVYEYQIIPTPVFNNFDDVDTFLDFVKFLKFDNTSFLYDLITDMDVQIKDINYFKGLTDIASDTKIINHIENISFKFKYNSYIYQYLINQSKKPLIEWLEKIYDYKKSDVYTHVY